MLLPHYVVVLSDLRNLPWLERNSPLMQLSYFFSAIQVSTVLYYRDMDGIVAADLVSVPYPTRPALPRTSDRGIFLSCVSPTSPCLSIVFAVS